MSSYAANDSASIAWAQFPNDASHVLTLRAVSQYVPFLSCVAMTDRVLIVLLCVRSTICWRWLLIRCHCNCAGNGCESKVQSCRVRSRSPEVFPAHR
jgi:hypothetical protein